MVLTTKARRRSAVVGVSLAAVVAAAIVLDDGPDYQGVCADDVTRQRVDDSRCHSGGSGGAHWVYYSRGTRAPAVGADASGGSLSVPHGSSVSRGGFGRGGGVVGG